MTVSISGAPAGIRTPGIAAVRRFPLSASLKNASRLVSVGSNLS